MLKDLNLDSMASTLAAQIDSCGRILLDIIDHLLDFATLKGQRIEKGAVSSAKIRRRISLNESKTSADDDLADVDTSVSLDDLTEEAVESTVYSFNCKKGAEYEPRATVILDVDRSSSHQWDCRLATGGWRRICINLITNALKYTPTGFIRVSLSQRPRPGLERQFDAVFTVTDSGKGMSKDFLENHLFRDFAQEDTLADGIGLGMHMVGRIVHAIGAKIDVVSEQDGPGAGTSVTVTVPLEHSPNHEKNSDTLESAEKSTALTALKVRIIGNYAAIAPEATREERLISTASTMAMSSVKKSCAGLGLQLLEGDSTDCDLNFVFEPDFEYSVRAQDNDNSQINLRNKPCIVICNSNPSGKTIKASRDKEVIRLGAAVEYIAMPCGVKTIARAISSALIRQKELDLTLPHQNGEQQMLTATSKLEHIHSSETRVSPSIHAAAPPPALVSRPTIRSSKSYQGSERRRANSMLQAPQKHESVVTPPQHGPNSGAATTDLSQTTALPKVAAPKLLLVDDNKVNLQLLTMYAKKRGYAYVTAADGQMAVNAYQKSHEDSCLTASNGKSTSESQTPTVILMDINMPIMDGYEATQHIRTYEKKHQLPGAVIIALTALGSEAAYQEAFGSGCDMFLTKPVKLKDLTKVIEEM